MNLNREQPPPARARPSAARSERATAARVRRRRGVAAASLLAVLVAGLAIAHQLVQTLPSSATPARLTLESGGQALGRIALAPYLVRGLLAPDGLRQAVLARLPPTLKYQVGRAQITYALDRDAAARQAVADGPRGGTVDVSRRALSARIAAPIVRQRLRNNCETAALQILLATVGVNVDQGQLQTEVHRDGPLDPEGSGDTEVWGDPERGFVGRPDGGGPAGGFGVYQGPIAALALRHGRRLADLTRASPSSLYARVLSGHAVMAWIGFADGPYGQWRSPGGRLVRVNFNEHAIVLDGLTAAGMVQISNPLDGTREAWSKQTFEVAWNRLGRRALST